jgi:hypothetical protein
VEAEELRGEERALGTSGGEALSVCGDGRHALVDFFDPGFAFLLLFVCFHLT